jgi:hypothetical protein
LGTVQPQNAPNRSVYSKIIAFQESTNFTYVLGDGTDAYPRLSFSPSGYIMPAQFATLHSGGALSSLKKVQRHFLFMRKKYFVIFDDLESTTPAKYSWLYHVLENTLSMNTNNASFQYTNNTVRATAYTTNLAELFYATGVSSFPPDVTVQVTQMGRPQDLEMLDLTGTNVCSNPITGENYYDVSDTLHPRAHAIWVSNKVLQTKFHFMTVIYPVKPGTAPPVINRLDDFTAEITNGSEHDVISFDSQTTQPVTLVVDLAAAQLRPSPPTNLRLTP